MTASDWQCDCHMPVQAAARNPARADYQFSGIPLPSWRPQPEAEGAGHSAHHESDVTR